jgi:hypothetical protein
VTARLSGSLWPGWPWPVLGSGGCGVFEHRLMDFNHSPETQLRDVKRVLNVAAERLATRLRESRR